MKKIETRLAKLEEASGIGKPCDLCALHSKQKQIFCESLTSQGVKLHKPKAKDLNYERCEDCGLMMVVDYSFLSRKDRVEHKRLMAEGMEFKAEGSEPDRDWWARSIAALDREEAAYRAFYGPAFDVAQERAAYRLVRQIMEEKMQGAPGL